ncbi:MAG TPA: ATP synthase F1 subunit epsilon [Candidatus Saccharimonadales bacterium]|nr:ATP synthase F1 subunit epsilon [Candidatus Saccharimonadales bacterium]
MIHLQLISLAGVKFDEDVYEVLLPTLEGTIGVLPGHMPLIAAATNGVISVRRNMRDPDFLMEHFATNGGVVEIADNNLKVLVDEADHAEEINEAEAKAAHERALKLKAEAKDEVSLEHAQTLVDRTSVRLQVAGLKRRKHQKQ